MHRITSEERHTIAILLKQGKSENSIAKELNRHRSSILREIKRNRDQRSGYYHYDLAQRKALNRKKSKPTRCSLTPEIKTHVLLRLITFLSPEQIVGEAKLAGIPCISHESIYRFIWADKRSGGTYYQYLRHRSKRYRKRGASKDKRGQILNKVDIGERPPIVEQRIRLGDMEQDLIIGKNHQGAILTINDRCSGLLKMILLKNKNADAVANAVIQALSQFKNKLYTITSDNGKEFANHEIIAKELAISYYFAKPYHSWERGSNENLNGLIRQFIPKDTDINTLTETEVAKIEELINNRPRKRHNFLSPLTIHNNLTLLQLSQINDVALAC